MITIPVTITCDRADADNFFRAAHRRIFIMRTMNTYDAISQFKAPVGSSAADQLKILMDAVQCSAMDKRK